MHVHQGTALLAVLSHSELHVHCSILRLAAWFQQHASDNLPKGANPLLYVIHILDWKSSDTASSTCSTEAM